MTIKQQQIGLQAVIVLYNCQPEKSMAVNGFYQATRDFPGKISLLIYDNSPTPAHSLPVLSGLNLVYQHDESNPGVSKAYNTGAKLAAQNNLQWLLLLDQDTEIKADYLAMFVAEQAKNSWCKVFAPFLLDHGLLVSPFRWKRARGSVFKKSPQPGSLKMKNLALANSGLIINTDFFQQIGGYTPDIRLDFADIDFCSKVAARDEEFILLNCQLKHSLSGLNGNDPVATMIRLTKYCHSALIFARLHKLYLLIAFRLFVKSLQLSIKFKRLRFLKIFAKEYLELKKQKNG